MNTLINKTYIANDNSYSKNLTSNKEHYLAGTMIEDLPKQTKIVSEPYKETINTLNGLKEMEFINVEYKGDTVRVMFDPKNVNRDLQEAIKTNFKRREIFDSLGF